MRTFVILVLSSITCNTLAQQMAITFDDAPFGYSADLSEEAKVKTFDQLLLSLDQYGVKATFLITSGNITEVNSVILDKAKAAGHQLGNHTHRHLNLNEVTAAKYMADIDSCTVLAGKWMNSPYFRYSYLRRGNSRQKRDSVYAHIQKVGYRMAPVTLDNDEWIFNRDYSIARRDNKTEEMSKQTNTYLSHMATIAANYRQKAVDLMGREIPHILLLHVNPLNCDQLYKLLMMYQAAGWSFVTLDEAMQDAFYQLKDDYAGPHGFSQIDRIEQHALKPTNE